MIGGTSEQVLGARLLRWSVPIGVVAALVLVGGVLVSWLGPGYVARYKLDGAATAISTSDAAIASLDAVIRAKVSDKLAPEADAALVEAKRARKVLDSALVLARDARHGLGAADRERADLLAQAIHARIELIDAAVPLVEYNAQASRALGFVRQAGTYLESGNALFRKAIAAGNRLKRPDVENAQALHAQANEQFGLARGLLSRANDAFPTGAFADYLDFLTARLESNALARRANKAWLAGNLDEFDRLSEQYNKLDRVVGSLAKVLPSSPEKGLAKAFALLANAQTDAYYRAREGVLTIDARLRTWEK